MYLHKEDRELLHDIIMTVSEKKWNRRKYCGKRLLCDIDSQRIGNTKSECCI